MKGIKYLLLVFLFAEIISCKKEVDSSVSGTAYDKSSQTLAPNYHVYLIERYPVSGINVGGLFPSSYQFDTLRRGVTDANGFYYFAFEARKNNKYTYYLNSTKLYKGQDNRVSFDADGKSLVSVNFLPPPPYNTGDSLEVIFSHSVYQSEKYKITNTNYLTYHQLIIYDGKYYVDINKYKSGVYTNIKDTVFYKADSTYQYDVNW